MKNVLIAGASGRLGAHVTTEFSKTDFYLHLANRSKLETTGNQSFYSVDMTNPDAVKQVTDEIAGRGGAPVAGINLTGGFAPGALAKTGVDDLEKMIRINFVTAFNLVSALSPHFQKNGEGKFIFIGARMAVNPEVAGKVAAAYALSKQLLLPLAAMVNAQGKANGITAHVLLPGTIDFPEAREQMPDADFSTWTDPVALARTMVAIVEGKEHRTEITF